MKLTASEVSLLRLQGVFVTETCDACGKVLNQSFRYTVGGKPGVFCSAVCRDTQFFAGARDAGKYATPGRCAYCGADLVHKNRGSLYCGDACRKAYSRRGPILARRTALKSRTATSWNQLLTQANLDR